MLQVKAADSAIVYTEEIDITDATDIDMAMEKLEKEAIEVNVRFVFNATVLQ